MTQRNFIDFLNLVGVLKYTSRHCWNIDGERETVADHSWRLALMPLLLEKDFPDVDINKVIRMCLIHDFGEAITGDIPAYLKTDEHEAVEREAIKGLLTKLPSDLEAEFSALFDEMDALETKEAKLYKALDNMEALIAHNESDISTWMPHEYNDAMTYGADKVEWNDWLKALRQEIVSDSVKKINEAKE